MKKFLLITWILISMYFLAGAQDVTLSGPGPCGSGAASGTWTVPCNVTVITIEVYGGGGGAGGGGGGSNGGFFNTRGGGGGGGGGFTAVTINVTPGSSFTYSVGAGGCGGGNGSDGSSGGNGNAGGNSTFNGTDAGGSLVNLTANGGARGTSGSGTNGSPGSGGAGGSASGGTTNTAGGAGNNGSGGNGGPGGAGAGPSGGAGGANTNNPGIIYGGGGAGGGDSPGGRGAAGGILITYNTTVPLPGAPLISAIPPTCTTDGISVISNYNAALTYIFSPAGPTAGAGGTIFGMITGTSYTVEASDGNCTSPPSASFSNAPAIPLPVPTISTTPPTCTADGSSVISNYNAAFVYLFTPAGPSAGAGGVITGMLTGTSYTVEADDGICTSAPSAPFSNTAQFPTPVASLSGSLSYCTSGNTTLTASGGTSYVWTDGGGNNIGNNASVTVTQGTYEVVVTDANGCIVDTTVTVIESTNLLVTISGNLSYCPGENTTLTANGGTIFIWNDAGSSTTASITVTAGAYTVTASDGTGCTGTASATVTESVSPAISISGTLNYCPGDSTTLMASGGNSYEWNDAGNSTTADITVTQGSYTVTGTDADGCTATAVATVTESALPNITISGSLNHCEGGNTTISASGGTNYQWADEDGNNIGNSASISLTEGTYTVNVTDANGCENTEEVIITQVPAPVADFSVNPDCAGQPISFTNNSTPAGLNYSWDFGNGNTSADAETSPVFSQGGNFTITLIVSDGSCSDTATQTLQVYEQPVAAFTALPVRVVQSEENVEFTNSSSAADTYLWDFGDGETSSDFAPSHTYGEIGIYTVTLIAGNSEGCIDTLSRIDYIEAYDKPIIYIPNAFTPNGDGLNDEFLVYGSGINEINFTIFDRWGSAIFNTDDVNQGWDGTIHGKDADPGVYVYYVRVKLSDLTFKKFSGSVTLLK